MTGEGGASDGCEGGGGCVWRMGDAEGGGEGTSTKLLKLLAEVSVTSEVLKESTLLYWVLTCIWVGIRFAVGDIAFVFVSVVVSVYA